MIPAENLVHLFGALLLFPRKRSSVYPQALGNYLELGTWPELANQSAALGCAEQNQLRVRLRTGAGDLELGTGKRPRPQLCERSLTERKVQE